MFYDISEHKIRYERAIASFEHAARGARGKGGAALCARKVASPDARCCLYVFAAATLDDIRCRAEHVTRRTTERQEHMSAGYAALILIFPTDVAIFHTPSLLLLSRWRAIMGCRFYFL